MNYLSTVFDCSKYACAKLRGNYVKYYIAFDVRSIHILRVQTGYNEEYEPEEGCVLLEHEMVDYYPEIIRYFEENKLIDMEYTGDVRKFIDWLEYKIERTDILKAIVDWDEQNGLENWDCRGFPMGDVDEIVDEYIIQSDTLSSITI